MRVTNKKGVCARQLVQKLVDQQLDSLKDRETMKQSAPENTCLKPEEKEKDLSLKIVSEFPANLSQGNKTPYSFGSHDPTCLPMDYHHSTSHFVIGNTRCGC